MLLEHLDPINSEASHMTAPTLIVTGASRGIGASTARLAAAAGWNVCISYQHNRALAQAVADDVTAAGTRALLVQADVSVEDDVLRMFDSCEAELGKASGLVNNAGITGSASTLADASADTLRDVININVVGALLCAQEAARRFDSGSAVVNVSSAAANLGSPNEFVWYAASKGAMDSLTLGLAKELGPKGIRVNAVSPGLINTDIHEASGIENRLEKLVGGVPLGRAGEPEEIGAAIVWLLSDAAGYVSGANLRLGGGR